MTLHSDFASKTSRVPHFYANGTTGNDANSGLVVGAPKLTLGAVFALVPDILSQNCVVHLAGTFDEFGTVRLNKHILDGVTLFVSGEDDFTVFDDNGGAHFATAGGTTIASITEAVGGLGVDAYKGYFLHVLDGADAGDVQMLQGNTAGVLTPCSNFAVDPGVGGATFDIVRPTTLLTSTVAPSTLYLNNSGSGSLIVQLLSVGGTQCGIQALGNCYARQFSHITVAGTLAVPLRLKQSVVSLFGSKYDVVEGSGTFGTQLTDSHGGVGVVGAYTTYLEDVHYAGLSSSTFGPIVAQNTSFNNVHHGCRFKGLSTFKGCSMITAATFTNSVGYAPTTFDLSGTVNVLVSEGSHLVFDDVDVADATGNGIQVERHSVLEMTGIVTSSAANGAFGCFITQGGHVKITSGAAPSMTGASGDVTIDGTNLHCTWAEVDAALPGHMKVKHETFQCPTVGGTNVHAQFAGDFNTGAGITQPDYPRNLQVDFNAAWDGGNVVVTGVGADGRTRTETFVDPGGAGVVVGTEAFAVITNLENTGTFGAGTVDVQLAAAANTVLGVTSRNVAAFLKMTIGTHTFGASLVPTHEAVAAEVLTKGTFRPTTAPTAAIDYHIWYSDYSPPVSIRE